MHATPGSGEETEVRLSDQASASDHYFGTSRRTSPITCFPYTSGVADAGLPASALDLLVSWVSSTGIP